MKSKYTELLKYMLDNRQTLTSNVLANALNCSVRSIKSYISQINDMANAKVIISSKSGYSLNTALAHAFLQKNNLPIPQNYDERANYIIKQFIIEHTNTLDLYDLCENLYISESTIKADINKLNKQYAQYGIHFNIDKSHVMLDAEERSLRKLFSSIIYDDVGNHYMDLNQIKGDFKKFDVREILPIIRNTFTKYHYYINDVALINLVMHIAIVIDRLLDGRSLNENESVPQMTANDRQVSDELCNQLEKKYSISIVGMERNEINILVKTNANLSVPNNIAELSKCVEPYVMEMTNSITHMLEEKYMIDLSNPAFVVPFALHLRNMVYRSKAGKNINNPMSGKIMYGHPLVYDMAVSVSMQLIDKYGINCNPSETSFLALHIGGEIERQKMNEAKIATVLLCPNYMNLETRLYNSILLNFSSDISIVATVSSLDSVEDIKFDLLMSTVDVPDSRRYVSVIIPPFASQLNKTEIQGKIEQCKNNMKNHLLKQRFDEYFMEDLFYANIKKFRDSSEVIDFMAEKLSEKEYAPKNYAEMVKSRESAASTAFNSIAIPHSMEMNCYRTCISVLIDKEGISWGTQNVRIVLMMSISPHASHEFSQLYEALVVLFSDDKSIDMFQSCNSFQEFKKTLFSLVK
jgi:lichenan operon transcriptional antiterminator